MEYSFSLSLFYTSISSTCQQGQCCNFKPNCKKSLCLEYRRCKVVIKRKTYTKTPNQKQKGFSVFALHHNNLVLARVGALYASPKRLPWVLTVIMLVQLSYLREFFVGFERIRLAPFFDLSVITA